MMKNQVVQVHGILIVPAVQVPHGILVQVPQAVHGIVVAVLLTLVVQVLGIKVKS
jgi:hypothetical protein